MILRSSSCPPIIMVPSFVQCTVASIDCPPLPAYSHYGYQKKHLAKTSKSKSVLIVLFTPLPKNPIRKMYA